MVSSFSLVKALFSCAYAAPLGIGRAEVPRISDNTRLPCGLEELRRGALTGPIETHPALS